MQLLLLLSLEDTERVDRLVGRLLVRQCSVVLANSLCIDTRHLLYWKNLGVDFLSFDVVAQRSIDNPLRIWFDTDSHLLLVAPLSHCIYIVRKVRTLGNVYH